ncbi:MAG: hypothetical protein WBX25_17550 [Rhodomicrobium sp.]
MSDKSPRDILEGLRDIIAREMIEKPQPREKAIADPALWRAIQIQQRCGGNLLPDAFHIAMAQKS